MAGFSGATIFLLLGVMVASAFGLQCYDCDSTKNAACASPFNETLFEPVTCDASMDACIAYTGTVLNVKMTTRSCASKAAEEPCDVSKRVIEALGGTQDDCYSCTTDKCNSADGLGSAFFVVTLTVAIPLLFNKF